MEWVDYLDSRNCGPIADMLRNMNFLHHLIQLLSGDAALLYYFSYRFWHDSTAIISDVKIEPAMVIS